MSRRSKWDVPSSSPYGPPPTDQQQSQPASQNQPQQYQEQPSVDNAEYARRAAERIGQQLAEKTETGGGEQQSKIQTQQEQQQEAGEEGKFVKDIEINDCKNRYILTKGQTHKEIYDKTGATVIPRGRYVRSGEQPPEGEKPLYLHIVAQTQEGLDRAENEVRVMMQHGNRPPPGSAQPGAPPQQPQQLSQQQLYQQHQQKEMIVEKVYIGIEGTEDYAAFNLPARLIGERGLYVKHISRETGTRVQLRGRGSKYCTDINEPLYFHITGWNPKGIQKAKELAQDLIETVRKDFEEFKSNGGRAPQRRPSAAPPAMPPGYGPYAGYPPQMQQV